MELLERDQQLEALRALLHDVEGGRGRLALISGKAGSGKSALLRQFCETFAAVTPALWGMCDPLSAPRSLGPLLDIAPQLGQELAPALALSNRERVFEPRSKPSQAATTPP